jgi:hypothetical protein
MTTETANHIYKYGFICELRTARKACVCRECKGVIRKGEHYYHIVIGGGGLLSLKFPNRVQINCLDSFLERYREAWEKQEAFIERLKVGQKAGLQRLNK